jgi:hypothetical protein
VRVRVPFLVPLAVGLNVTSIVQLLFGGTGVPQLVLAGGKSTSPKTELKVKVAAPELVTFTVFAPLVVPTTCLLNVKLVVERVAVWANAGEPQATRESQDQINSTV